MDNLVFADLGEDESDGDQDSGNVPLGWHLPGHWAPRLEAQVRQPSPIGWR